MTERESGGRADPDGGEPALDTIDLCDLDRFVDGFPHDTFRLLRAIAPVWFHPPTPHTPGGEGFWVLSRHRDVLAAAGDPTTFSSHTGGTRGGGGTLIDDLPEGFTGVLLNMTDDPFHRRFRSLLTPTVAPRAIAAMEEELRDRTRSIVASALDAEFVDLLVDVAAELPLQAAAALLGVPQQDRSLLVEWADATLDHADDDPADGAERAAAASAAMFAYGDELICRRRESPGDDLLSAAVHGTVGDTTAYDGRCATTSCNCCSHCSSLPGPRPPATRSRSGWRSWRAAPTSGDDSATNRPRSRLRSRSSCDGRPPRRTTAARSRATWRSRGGSCRRATR